MKHYSKRVSFGYETDPLTGKSRQKRVTVSVEAPNKKEAERLLQQKIQEMRSVYENTDRQEKTIIDLIDRYQKDTALKPGTIARDRGCDKRIIKRFGKVSLSRIKIEDIMDFLQALYDQEGLAAGTVHNYRKNLAKYFRYAYALKWVPEDIFAAMKRRGIGCTPGYKGNQSQEKPDQVKQVIQYIMKMPGLRLSSLELKVQVLLALDCCLRTTELYGLKWSDFDLEAKEVLIQRDLTVLTKKEAKLQNVERKIMVDTKTAGSKRKLPLSEITVRYLRLYYEETNRYLAKKMMCNTNQVVFFQRRYCAEGLEVEPQTMAGLKIALRKISIELGIPVVTPYDFRRYGRTLRENEDMYPDKASLYVIGHVRNRIDNLYVYERFTLAKKVHFLWEKILMETIGIEAEEKPE